MAKKLRVSLKKGIAMEATRLTLGKKKLVYVILAQRKLKYPWGKSKIAYIGTTKKGVARIAQSVATRAEAVLGLHGTKKCIVRIITCSPKRNVKTWVELEKSLLFIFRREFGDVPKCNKMGKKLASRLRDQHFNEERLKKILIGLDD